MSKEKTAKEPLFHITKRDPLPLWQSWLIRVAAVLIGILISSLFVVITAGQNPFSVFASIIHGAFGDPGYQTEEGVAATIWQLIQELAILLGIAIAITPAFKMKYWNTGAEGQVLFGALITAMISAYWGKGLSGSGFGQFFLIVLMMLGGILGGALWAVLPALCKAKWNTNETLFTLMMNYVAISLVNVFLKSWDPSHGEFIVVNGQFPVIGIEYLGIVLVSVVLTAAMYVYLKYSKHGYEISVVGESHNTAKYIGLSVGKVTVRTLLVSGSICGFIGAMLIGSIKGSLTTDIVGGYGFTAILVSWLAKFNPLFMILTAFLVVFFKKGSNQIASDFGKYGLTKDFGDVIVGIVFFCIIGCEFFLNYSIKFNKKHGEVK